MTRPNSATALPVCTKSCATRPAPIRACRSTRRTASNARPATSRTRARTSCGRFPVAAKGRYIPECEYGPARKRRCRTHRVAGNATGGWIRWGDCGLAVIPDVQGGVDSRCLPIDRVGIKGIRHPVQVRDRDGGIQQTVAVFNMYVGLPQHFKGTHMSRFVEILNHGERVISIGTFESMLREMTTRLDAETCCVEMSFPYFVNKTAPVSGVQSLMDYAVTFIGEIVAGGEYRQTNRIVVPVTSLCPCSRDISRHGAHNQRSHVTVSVCANDFVWIEELIEMVEREGSCELFGLLKRPDEKYVTERAYDNPKDR